MSESNAFMASRGSSTVLETIPPNQLHDAPRPQIRKRKLSATSEWPAENIIIRAHAASLYDEPYVLEPLAVIPQHQLPFQWLDIPSTLSQIQSGSLFAANIPALEDQHHHEPKVLIVRLASDGGLYVIERVKRGIYSLSKLSRGVEEGDVRVLIKSSSQRLNILPPCTPRKQDNCVAGGDWWAIAQVDDPAPDMSLPLPAKRAKVELVFGVSGDSVENDERMKGVSPIDSMDRSSSCDVRMVSIPPVSQPPAEAIVSGEVDENMGEAPQSSQELLDGLREQYLQALYVSKASVAYFAKGPLPRCRVAFQAPDSINNISELVAFYHEAILPTKKMDLKFRETLPATLHDIVLTVSDDDAAPKKRKSKKKTLGRNGLYTMEPDYIRGWWKNRAMTETSTSIETSRDAEIKKHVADLRMRETQLQILLILETIALETAAADEAKKAGQDDASAAPSEKPKAKTKKFQDLNVMLELHLDRLCIWHAVSFDDASVTESQASGSNHQNGKGGSDAMRDFCTEVIIPFYASRLPDRCKAITRKLGVSVGTASPFPKTVKKPRKELKESEATERNPQKSRRTLHRVLTDEQAASQVRSQPSLHRSITAPSQIESKRETTPLLPSLSTSVRGGIQKAKRAENREVDLFAVARQHETKLKRVQMLADQKKELDAAIHALRKPNRELVAKDIAQDAEKRSSSSRKPKNPVRNPLGQGVQVMATPSKVRKRDAVGGLPLPKSVTRSKTKTITVPTSSPFTSEPQVIPGSTIRPSSFSGAPFNADSAVQETPSRRSSQQLSFSKTIASPIVSEPPVPGTGNLFRVPRRPAPRPTETNPLTPVKSQSVNMADADVAPETPQPNFAPPPPPPPPPLFALPSRITPSKSSMIFETPPRPKAAAPIPEVAGRRPSVTSAPAFGGAAASLATSMSTAAPVIPVTPEKSIYSALGWDNDDDELAL